MKVITIGRSSENDITVNNPNVSRHHCQIVQFDNGTFGVVDFGSTNGTYVNGRRVYGQVSLKQGDRVHIAQTELPWQQYFPAASKKRTNWWLWPTIGGAAAIMVLAVVLVLWRTGIIGTKEILYNGPEPPIATVTLEEGGVSYDVEAAEGQLIVMFEESVPHRKAVKILKNNNATIVAQIPDVQYYLVEVPAGKEAELYSRLRNYPEVDYVYPKTINVLCSATPYIFDNFSSSDHGSRVATMLGSSNSTYKKEDLGLDEEHVSDYTQPLIANLKKLKDGESAVINMSFGPGLIRLFAIWPWQHRPLWNDHLVTEGNQESYKRRYINELKQMIKLVDTYDNKDFVIVKSAGNEGMKEMELIIDELQNQLSPEEYAVFERHFIIVSANDDNKEGDYPNDVKKYHKMVTKVDISDMTAKDLHWQGTSFSAPRAAGFITTVANSNNMKVTDVLEYARKATKKAPDHILTQELLEKAIEEEIKKDNSESEYKSYGCLKYRLIKGNELEDERLELRNTCNEDIRVTGYLLNTIASNGGENTLDFETVVRAGGMEYVEGFVQNECIIKSVEKVAKRYAKPASSNASISNQGLPSSLVGTSWREGQNHIPTYLYFIDNYHVKYSDPFSIFIEKYKYLYHTMYKHGQYSERIMLLKNEESSLHLPPVLALKYENEKLYFLHVDTINKEIIQSCECIKLQ